MLTPFAPEMFVPLYLTQDASAFARAFASDVPSRSQKSIRSIWLIFDFSENLRVEARALDTVW